MRTLRYTENEYVEATKNIWRKLPDEFKVFNLPRDEEGYMVSLKGVVRFPDGGTKEGWGR